MYGYGILQGQGKPKYVARPVPLPLDDDPRIANRFLFTGTTSTTDEPRFEQVRTPWYGSADSLK